MKWLFLLLFLIMSSGCTSVATFFAVKGVCGGSNSHCGNSGVAVDAAIKAFEIDNVLYAEIKNRLPAGPESEDHTYLTAESELCMEGRQWVCYAGRGCVCQSGD